MTKLGCFCALLRGNRKKSKDVKKAKRANGNEWQKVKPVESMDGTDAAPVVRKGGVGSAPARDTHVVAETAAELACPRRGEKTSTAAELACPGRGDKATTETVQPNVDLVGGTDSAATDSSGCSSHKDATSTAAPDDGIVSGGALPGVPSVLSKLQRSCSNIETGRSGWRKAFDDMLPPVKSRSHADLVALPTDSSVLTSPNVDGGASPASSVKTTCSADTSDADVCHSHQQDGYTSDTLRGANKHKKIAAAVEDEQPTAPSQWAAFSAEASSSSLDRVSAWVSSSLIHAEEEDGIVMEIGESSGAKGHVQAPAARRRSSPAVDDAVQARSVVQTLNAFSTVAHVSGMGLKVVPMISAFSSLRAVNLSGNLIAQISPGSLPKGLHSLDLSRNNIATIEGLRELTRLRVLSLSYNRISRMGHGLSSCTAIRELYLAGNKISDVEGLHRLLKLAVLDVSFNRITTARGLGQLVANYSSLRALNLLGNPVQANVGDDTLRKAVSSLLPRLEYLNRQAVKPQRAREAAKDSVAKAALGNSRWSSRRRASSRRSSLSPGSSAKGRDRGGSSRSRSKNRVQSSTVTRR